MNRLIEILLGLPRQFLSREGELAIRFNPAWPWQDTVGAAVWNVLIAGLLLWLIVFVYRREGRSPKVRISLGVLRGLLAALVLLLLNRPIVTLTQNRTEPSVVALLIDDSLSMRIRDVASTAGEATTRPTISRLDAVREVLGDANAGLLKELAKDHTLRLYRFDRDAASLGSASLSPTTGALQLPEALATLTPDGQSTSLSTSLTHVAAELAGQRLAGIVLLTDGRETPAKPIADTIARLRATGNGTTKIYSIEVGGDRAPRNLSVQNLVLQDAAFKGDLVAARVTIRGTGYPPGTRVTVRLTDAKTKRPLTGVSATGAPAPAETQITITGEDPIDVEVPLNPDTVGQLDVAATVMATEATAASGGGEIDDQDNTRVARLAVLDAKLNVLYVEGYPRWDYRYLRTELIRDKSVEVSILLTSADEGFAQDGDRPIRRLPESMDELLPYDAVIIGDVDPRQFTDAQMQLLADYVGKKGGGLLMAAGPRFAPARYRNTPLEAVLPVSLGKSALGEELGGGDDITLGFRPNITPAGFASGIFRFLPDKTENEKYLKNDLQLVFWYLKGIAVKPGAGEVLAEHPTELGPDGKKAPILVAGRYGAGRTLFTAIDDSWRWRYYTGESVFDTYWVQQIRLLARNRKLGQRLYSLSSSRSTYELGEQVSITLRILDPNLQKQLPDRIEAKLTDDAADSSSGTGGDAGPLLRTLPLIRQEDHPDTYTATFPADHLGRAKLSLSSLAPGVSATTPDTAASIPLEVIAPRLELTDVRVDRPALERLASETQAKSFPLDQAREKFPPAIQSAAQTIPLESSRPLWNAPIAMLVFVLLLTAEWILRKLYGMV